MTITASDLPMEKIAQFCDRWQVTEFALFGSVLREDFRPDSDIDVMVEFHPQAHPTFSTLDQMEAELKTIFHRDVDLITRQRGKGGFGHLYPARVDRCHRAACQAVDHRDIRPFARCD